MQSQLDIVFFVQACGLQLTVIPFVHLQIFILHIQTYASVAEKIYQSIHREGCNDSARNGEFNLCIKYVHFFPHKLVPPVMKF